MTDSERFNLVASVLMQTAKYDLHDSISLAYKAGALAMQDKIVSRLGDYDANKCAQIAAGVTIETTPEPLSLAGLVP